MRQEGKAGGGRKLGHVSGGESFSSRGRSRQKVREEDRRRKVADSIRKTKGRNDGRSNCESGMGFKKKRKRGILPYMQEPKTLVALGETVWGEPPCSGMSRGGIMAKSVREEKRRWSWIETYGRRHRIWKGLRRTLGRGKREGTATTENASRKHSDTRALGGNSRALHSKRGPRAGGGDVSENGGGEIIPSFACPQENRRAESRRTPSNGGESNTRGWDAPLLPRCRDSSEGKRRREKAARKRAALQRNNQSRIRYRGRRYAA